MLQLERVFVQHVPARDGVDCLTRLRRSVTQQPMLLIAGDQLTGKSTLARNLADRCGATYWSVGNAFRAVAAERGISPGELSERLLQVRLLPSDARRRIA